MTSSIAESQQGMKQYGKEQPEISQCLSPGRIGVGLNVTSKKRLLERMAAILLKDSTNINRDTVFQILTERERLGSTGIGYSVALPHGRVNGLDKAIGAVATLAKPLDFDAIDGEPVTLVFGLLVPAEANEEHLKLLAHLASMFSNPELRTKVMAAETPSEIYHLLTEWKPKTSTTT
ncbi:MAG: PTS sugar transporter subunit IIA [Gammaproteobacteria bacterium]|nr:PTS sugar transporter subunit IIA [Gammaproteobacteria bacterium]